MDREQRYASPHTTWDRHLSSDLAGPVHKAYILRLLYDGAIGYLNQAQKASNRKNSAARILYIDQALNIVHELSRSLEGAHRDETAENLRKLYIFWVKSLNRAKRLESNRSLKEMVDMITAIRAICLVEGRSVRKTIRAA